MKVHRPWTRGLLVGALAATTTILLFLYPILIWEMITRPGDIEISVLLSPFVFGAYLIIYGGWVLVLLFAVIGSIAAPLSSRIPWDAT